MSCRRLACDSSRSTTSAARPTASAGRSCARRCVPAPWADPHRPLWIKPENLQAIGAFKVRGAFNAIGRLDPDVRARGVVAYSSGNHAQAVAYAASVFGVPAHIVMPEETPGVKVEATRGHGAEVVLCGAGQREKVADEVVARTGGVLVPPFDHPDVIAGQGTIGLEIAEDLPDVANVLDPGQRRRAGLRHRHRDQGAVPARQGLSASNPNSRRTPRQALRPGIASTGHRGPQPHHRRRPAVTAVRTHLRAPATGARRADHRVRERHSRCGARDSRYKAHLVAEPSGAVALAAYRLAPRRRRARR